MTPGDIEELGRHTSAFEGAVGKLGRLLAVYAEIEMMRATNAWRDARGEAQAYGEEAFAVTVNTIESILAT